MFLIFFRKNKWKMIVTYIRHYQSIGIILKKAEMEEPLEGWVDMEQLKKRVLFKSPYGTLQFLEEDK